MDAIDRLYELEGESYDYISDLIDGPEIPAWIEQDITCDQVAAILQGGCASGAYMPAVTYHQAAETMAEHGDEVFEYADERDVLRGVSLERETWSGLACKILSAAVEAWASDVASAIENTDSTLHARPLSWDEAIKARDAGHD